jgi:hypothetical protein
MAPSPMTMARKGRRRNRRHGTAAIEFALLAPLLVILLTGLIEMGFGAYEAMEVQEAAEAGAQFAALHGWDADGIAAAVVNAVGGAGITASPDPQQFCGCATGTGILQQGCATTCSDGRAAGSYIQVNATIPHHSILPFPGTPLPDTLSGQSTIRIQ